MQGRVVAVVAVVMLVVGASVTYGWLALRPPAPETTTVTHLNVGNILFMQVGSGLYYADEVTAQTVVPADGNSYFTNKSITFYGVTFTTVCPTSLVGCPGGTNGTAQTTEGTPGAYAKVTIQFPDGKRETIFGSVGFQVFATYVSNHSDPTAGVAFEYIQATKSYRVFLLVTPYTLPQQGV